VLGEIGLLGPFAKLRKATMGFVLTARPSIPPYFCPHGETRLPLD